MYTHVYKQGWFGKPGQDQRESPHVWANQVKINEKQGCFDKPRQDQKKETRMFDPTKSRSTKNMCLDQPNEDHDLLPCVNESNHSSRLRQRPGCVHLLDTSTVHHKDTNSHD